jgi:chemotaxis protein methyltransferase CheR
MERLVAARLGRHIRNGGHRSFEEYLREVSADASGEQLIVLIDSLTTNHTGFLRDIEHFDYLSREVFPKYQATKPLAIWSAASSTGEEPYSILFTSMDSRYRFPPGIRLTASDISRRALVAARSGIYTDERVAGLPSDWKAR